MHKEQLPKIHTNLESYELLAAIAERIKGLVLEEIEFDFSHCHWIDANMCAALRVILATAEGDFNSVKLTGLQGGVKSILQKNKFLEPYGHDSKHDTYGTIIPHRQFATHESALFHGYLEQHWRGKGIPSMTPALDRRFKESLHELFANAAEHSETKDGIFTTGQFFPKKAQLDFMIADTGIGFRRKIQKALGFKFRSDAAIEWALKDGNTTRRGVPGGQGLKLIREFMAMNGGKIQIVSDKGFWEFAAGNERTHWMSHSFPGTLINIEINTNDTNSYRLSSETDEQDEGD